MYRFFQYGYNHCVLFSFSFNQANRVMSRGIDKSQFCAGEMAGNKDTCKFYSIQNRERIKKRILDDSTQIELVFSVLLCSVYFFFSTSTGQGDSGGPIQVSFIYCKDDFVRHKVFLLATI